MKASPSGVHCGMKRYSSRMRGAEVWFRFRDRVVVTQVTMMSSGSKTIERKLNSTFLRSVVDDLKLGSLYFFVHSHTERFSWLLKTCFGGNSSEPPIFSVGFLRKKEPAGRSEKRFAHQPKEVGFVLYGVRGFLECFSVWIESDLKRRRHDGHGEMPIQHDGKRE